MRTDRKMRGWVLRLAVLCDRHDIRVVWSLGCGDFTDVKRDSDGNWQYAGEHYRELISDPNSQGRRRLYRYIDETVSRYKGRRTVLMWEIGNEITLHADIGEDHVYHNQRMPTLKDVAGFHDDVARRIKAADPLRFDLAVDRNPELVKCIADANKRLREKLLK